MWERCCHAPTEMGIHQTQRGRRASGWPGAPQRNCRSSRVKFVSRDADPFGHVGNPHVHLVADDDHIGMFCSFKTDGGPN